jgi:hypothetical protein
MAIGVLLAACAEVPSQPARIERISAKELEARLPQPASAVSLADVVAMSHAGLPPAEIARRLDAAHARFRLSATQVTELHRQGVALTVLDHIVAAERRAVFEEVATDIARREQACNDRIGQELRQCRLQSFPALWPHPFATCWPPGPGHPFWRCF